MSTARLGRSALLALAATASCGGPNCPPSESSVSPRPVLVAELDDAGEHEPIPTPAYGAMPPPPPPCH